jgi:hypothetical protein
MKQRLELLWLLALLPAIGCYSYQSIPIGDVTPDLQVRLRVKPNASARVSQIIGYPIDDVEGSVVQVQNDTMLLMVPGLTTVVGGSVQRLYQRVDVPVVDIEDVGQRHLDRTKTYALVAAAAVGGGILGTVAFTAVINGIGQDRGVPTNNSVVAPVARLRGPFEPAPAAVPFERRLLIPLGRLPLAH